MRRPTIEDRDGDRDVDLRLPRKRLLSACWGASSPKIGSGSPLAGLPEGPWATLRSEVESKALAMNLDIFNLFEEGLVYCCSWFQW